MVWILVVLAGWLGVDLLEVVVVQLGFQVVLQAPVGWKVLVLVYLEVVEVVEVVALAFEVMALFWGG